MAAGLYLSIMRDRRGLSRKQVADRAGVSVQTIANLETGKKDPAWTLLVKFVDLVGANIEHVRELTNVRDDESRARRLAEMDLSPQMASDVQQFVEDNFTESDLDAIRRKLAEDPDFLDMLTESIGRQVLRRRT